MSEYDVVIYYQCVTVVIDVKLSESEKRLQEVDNKYEVLSLTLRDKQAACDLLQTNVDVSCSVCHNFIELSCLGSV